MYLIEDCYSKITTNTGKRKQVKLNATALRPGIAFLIFVLLLYRYMADRYLNVYSRVVKSTGVHFQQQRPKTITKVVGVWHSTEFDPDPNPNREAHSELQKSFYRSSIVLFIMRRRRR
jgi:hypothetical protein